jgi:hypothetical protein
VARWADARNLFGAPALVKSKLEILRGHCDRAGCDFETIERTNLTTLLLARDESALKAKKERLKLPDLFLGYALTLAKATDLVGSFQDAGSQMLIFSSHQNDVETLELFAAEVMPKFE